MISTDLFIVTPFSREQIDMASSACRMEPDITFTSYSVYVFRSRLEPFLRKYFSQTHRKKYDYDQFVFRDIPYEGKMVTTLILINSKDEIIDLSSQEVRDINLEISQMIVLHPNYLLFIQDYMLSYPQSWIRTILPSLEFQRTIYYPDDDSETKTISFLYDNGNIYLDLSQDPNYDTTLKKLYTDLLQKIEEYYYHGAIPNQLEVEGNGVVVKIRNPGDFLTFEGKVGDQVLEDIAGLEDIEPLESDNRILANKVKVDPNDVTVFVLDFGMSDINFDLIHDQIGVEFLVSLKKFLEADEVITKNKNPGFYEIVLKKDGKFIQSNLNIKEMFGYSYFTDHPLGLLVLDDMDLLEVSKIIYDSVSGKGGIFVPMTRLGDVIQMDLLHLMLNNRKLSTEVYTKTEDIEYTLMRMELDTVMEIENYLFVNKNRWITKRVIYRGTKQKYPKMLVSGSWDFDQISSSEVIHLGKEVLDEMKIYDFEIQEGPMNTLIIPVISLDFIQKFWEGLEQKIHEKYKPSRKF
jgi:hypothetical protein